MEITGRLDSDTAPRIEEDVALCIQSGAREMLLDCGGVTLITGAGLHSIIRMARQMEDRGGRLAICNPSPIAKQTFDVCGLKDFIPVYDDVESGKQALAA